MPFAFVDLEGVVCVLPQPSSELVAGAGGGVTGRRLAGAGAAGTKSEASTFVV